MIHLQYITFFAKTNPGLRFLFQKEKKNGLLSETE